MKNNWRVVIYDDSMNIGCTATKVFMDNLNKATAKKIENHMNHKMEETEMFDISYVAEEVA